MTIPETPEVPRLSWSRRLIGVVIAMLLVADIVAYGAARIRPDLVVLRDHFANWLTGTGVLLATLFLGAVAVFPIRIPAVQRVRPMVRMGLFVLMVMSFVFATITHGFNIFTYKPRIVATSPDGRLHAALVNNGQWSEIHVFTGSGFGERDVGGVGAPCNLDSIVFTSDTSLSVISTDDKAVIPLDPKTGAPLAVLQRTCGFVGQ